MPHAHTCQSTGKVEKNCMATNHWVKDRVLDWLAKDATIGAKALQKKARRAVSPKVVILGSVGWKKNGFGTAEREVG